MHKHKKAGISLIALSISGVLNAGELPNTENLQGLQFNFSTPGARSLGMGGAFIGRADDATAAFANPAGLTGLYAPEVSIEYRNIDYTTNYTDAVGSASGGSAPMPGTNSASSDVSIPSYFSYVKADPQSDWVFALFGHQLMDFETSFSPNAFDGGSVGTFFPTDNVLGVDIQTYGASFAYRASDKVSLGGSLVYYDFSMAGMTTRFDFDPNTFARLSTVANSQAQAGDDTATGVTLGAIFSATEKLNIGLVYRSTPDFDAVATNSILSSPVPFSFEIPDVYGIGFSYQASDQLTVNFDVNQVNYSDLTSPVIDIFDPSSTAPVGIDDATEIHLGLEYNIIRPNDTLIALRAGAWVDPAHTLEFTGNASNDIINSTLFQGGDDETHMSVGIGFIFGAKGQLDIAADFSENQDTISVSGVLRF